MNDNKRELQLFPLPGHSCSVTNDQWSGRYRTFELRQGISVNFAKISISRHLANTYEICTSNSDYIAGCIVLNGRLQIKIPGKKEFTIEPQKFSVFPAQDLNFQLSAPEQEKLYLLTYSFPGKLLRWLIKGRDSHVASCYRSDEMARCQYFGIPVSRKLHQSVAEIMGSRLGGRLHKIYLEGVILKILAQKFDLLENLPHDSDLLPPKSEEEMLKEAHEFLLHDLINPPTIKEIAVKVGIPEKRLTTSFKEVYGATIYDTLLAKRMAVAMENLKQDKLLIKQVAQSVGYKHVSNFISAFTKYHGLPPKAYHKYKE